MFALSEEKYQYDQTIVVVRVGGNVYTTLARGEVVMMR